MVLVHDQSPVFMAPAFEVPASFWLDEDQIVETFRSGEGLGWHAHNHRPVLRYRELLPHRLSRASGERMAAGA
jgi:hypothetical protein